MSQPTILDSRFAQPEALDVHDIVIVDILLCDASVSMGEQGFDPGKTKRELMYEAGMDYLAQKLEMRPQDYVAVIAYESRATQCCGLVNVGEDFEIIVTAMEQVRTLPSGGTCMSSGLKIAVGLAQQWLNGAGQLRAPHMETMVRVIAYTDGHDASVRCALQYTDQLKAMGCLIYTFGVGQTSSCVNEKFLKDAATEEGGHIHYQFLGNAQVVRKTFDQLGKGFLRFEG